MLYIISIIWLITVVLSALTIALDILFGRKQQMMIMNFVYPITGLYGSILSPVFYYKTGRAAPDKIKDRETNRRHPDHGGKPFWQSVIIGTLHCGSGCTIGDIFAEVFLLYIPLTLFENELLNRWTIDYAFAFIIGIIFQYYSIKPMKKLSFGPTLKAALKADSLSLTSWQLGMYGWMAIAIFIIFKHDLQPKNILF